MYYFLFFAHNAYLYFYQDTLRIDSSEDVYFQILKFGQRILTV